MRRFVFIALLSWLPIAVGQGFFLIRKVSTAAPSFPTTNLVAFYNCDEGTAATDIDETWDGAANYNAVRLGTNPGVGTDTIGSTAGVGYRSSSIATDDCETTNGFDCNSDFTVNCWVYVTNSSESGNNRIWSLGQTAASTAAVALVWASNADLELAEGNSTGTTWIQHHEMLASATQDQWYCVQIRWDSAVSEMDYRVTAESASPGSFSTFTGFTLENTGASDRKLRIFENDTDTRLCKISFHTGQLSDTDMDTICNNGSPIADPS